MFKRVCASGSGRVWEWNNHKTQQCSLNKFNSKDSFDIFLKNKVKSKQERGKKFNKKGNTVKYSNPVLPTMPVSVPRVIEERFKIKGKKECFFINFSPRKMPRDCRHTDDTKLIAFMQKKQSVAFKETRI